MSNLSRKNRNPFTFPTLAQVRNDFIWPMEDHFNRMVDTFIARGSADSVKANSGFPRMNVTEENGNFVIRAHVAGMSPSDISVEMLPDTNTVRISGQMSEEHRSPENAVYYMKELRSSTFLREIQLPDHVKGEPEALVRDGVLSLTWSLPKQAAKVPELKKIPVKVTGSVGEAIDKVVDKVTTKIAEVTE